MKILECYHLEDISDAPAVERLVKEGKLKDSVGRGKICDWRVPVDERAANGQDVACVEPEDSQCPDPGSARFVPIEEIEIR